MGIRTIIFVPSVCCLPVCTSASAYFPIFRRSTATSNGWIQSLRNLVGSKKITEADLSSVLEKMKETLIRKRHCVKCGNEMVISSCAFHSVCMALCTIPLLSDSGESVNLDSDISLKCENFSAKRGRRAGQPDLRVGGPEVGGQGDRHLHAHQDRGARGDPRRTHAGMLPDSLSLSLSLSRILIIIQIDHVIQDPT